MSDNLTIFGTDYTNAQAALQFPAGTYDALLAMWGSTEGEKNP